jgi:hypothetical protein
MREQRKSSKGMYGDTKEKPKAKAKMRIDTRSLLSNGY